jgi:glycosyltransferase involved in cell wall biosynthesis
MACGPLGGLAARGDALGVPVIVAWHGSDITRPARRTGRAEVARRARNVTVSRFLAETLRRETGATATVLPAPIDPLPPVEQGPRWLVVARLVATKGVDEALRRAAAHGRDVTIVGDGPERPSLEALARTLPIDVRFLGELPHAEIPWAGHEAVVLTPRVHADGSGAEGLGMVLVEGAARGLRAIGNEVGGVPEATSDGRWSHGAAACARVLETVAQMDASDGAFGRPRDAVAG